MYRFQSISSDELAGNAALLGISLSKILNLDELNVLGNYLVALGSIMLVIAAQEQALVAQKKDSADDTQKQINELREQLQQLLNQH